MRAFFIISFALFTVISLQAQTDLQVRIKHFNIENSLAIQGYDPVSYFKGKAMKGTKANAFTYKGVKYYFASVPNLEQFKGSPDKYEPAYGGWCAYAMGSDGSKVEVDPETFKIIDNKLYLFYNFYFNNTLKKWNPEEAALKSKADKNWHSLISE